MIFTITSFEIANASHPFLNMVSKFEDYQHNKSPMIVECKEKRHLMTMPYSNFRRNSQCMMCLKEQTEQNKN